MFNVISSATERFLADLSNTQDRLIKAQRQVSSGLRMQDVSDDPDHNAALLDLKAHIARNKQIKANLGHVQTEVNAAEGAINTATSILDNARQIVTEALNGTTQVSTRVQLANQVKALIGQIYSITNTTVEGRFVFSGNDDQIAPYASIDLTQANGLGTYQGSAATRVVEHPNGSTFSVSLTGQQLFDNGTSSTSVLKAMTNLYNNLANNNMTGLQSDAADLSTASDYLSGQQAQYGLMQNQVADALTFQSNLAIQYAHELSNLQDADAVAAITEMQQETLTQQAALQAHASLPKTSLFSFLG
jgi:flagellar hook-associated protein 3 FlgL